MTEDQVAKHKGVIGTLLRLLIIFIIADLFLIGSDLTVLAASDTESYHMLQLLTTGEFAIWFLGIELCLGAVLPLALLAHPKTRMIPGCPVCLRRPGDHRDLRDALHHRDRRPVGAHVLREQGRDQKGPVPAIRTGPFLFCEDVVGILGSSPLYSKGDSVYSLQSIYFQGVLRI